TAADPGPERIGLVVADRHLEAAGAARIVADADVAVDGADEDGALLARREREGPEVRCACRRCTLPGRAERQHRQKMERPGNLHARAPRIWPAARRRQPDAAADHPF